ncbi:MAG: metal-dependent hydrolase [Anaerolineales bacterium]|nr:metal-dependent hydrolase [Anaerolineales bacterium]
MSFEYIWYGHGTQGLVVSGLNVLVDPFLEDNPAASVSAADVPADFILVSHGHGDHISDAASVAKRTGALVISNFEISNWLGEQGVTTHGLHIGGGYTFPCGYVKLTQAVHGSALPDGSNGGNPAGFLLTTGTGEKIYLACDTGLFGDMELIGDEEITLATVPIGDNFTMGPDDALRAVKLIRPKHVVPVHYNTWDLISQDPHDWATRVEEETEAKVHVISPGEKITL